MDLSIAREGDVSVVRLTGRVLMGDGDAAMRQAIQALSDEGCRKIVLDLSGVPTMDSMALGQMVAAQTHVSRQGGVLKIAGANPRVHNLLSMVRLTSVFEMHADEAAAIASF